MPATSFLHAPWATPQGIVSQLIEPPAEEPLTLAEAKLRSGLDWAEGDPRDALMVSFIKAARQKVEQDTGLALIEQTRRVIIVNAPSGQSFPMPAQCVPTVSVSAEEGGVAPPELVDGTLPTAYTGTFLVVAGWPDAATLLAEAPLLVHAVGLLVGHMATLGRDLGSIDESFLVPLGYEDAIQPFRQQRVT